MATKVKKRKKRHMRLKPHLWTTSEIVAAIVLGCLAAAMTFLF